MGENITSASHLTVDLASTDLSVLRKIVEGTVQATGEDFFRLLVEKLSEATGIENAFVAEFAEIKTRARTLAYWSKGKLIENEEWELAGSPCEDVLKGNLCHYPSGVAERFAHHEGLESYLGVPLKDAKGEVLGHLAIYSDQEMPFQPQLLYIFQIFAARAASELSRIRAIEQLHETEDRFRDLFDEAPIAYVHEDLESRFIRANKTAIRVLGITPEQVPTTIGKTFIPDTPDAQRRLKEAFD